MREDVLRLHRQPGQVLEGPLCSALWALAMLCGCMGEIGRLGVLWGAEEHHTVVLCRWRGGH